MTGTQYNLTLTIFFISYSVFEVPSNILLKKLKPHVWLTATMVFWGICMTFMGFVTNYSGLLAARWFLGLCEAGLYVPYIVSILILDFRASNSTCPAGTNARNLVSAPQFSSPPPHCLGRSVDF